VIDPSHVLKMDQVSVLELARHFPATELAHIGDETDLANRFPIKREIVPLISLDEIMTYIDCPPVSFIKIDVEGGELDVLRGGIETLKKHRPSILCEIDNRESRFGAGKEDLPDFLRSLNYTPRRISDLAEIPWSALETNTVFTLNGPPA
ncbi:MAG: FkbM family methyltransferase, partial [Hyphomonas sp.]